MLIVAMVAEGDLGRSHFTRERVEDAAAQARTERAVRLALGHLLFDDGVGILLHDPIFVALALEVLGSRRSGKPG